MNGRTSILLLFPLSFVAVLLSFSRPASAEMKTFLKEYTYQASDEDSKNSSRTIALRQVQRLLLEELGSYLESETQIKGFVLTKDQITALTAGVVNDRAHRREMGWPYLLAQGQNRRRLGRRHPKNRCPPSGPGKTEGTRGNAATGMRTRLSAVTTKP
jgi:hypothetical protein